MKSFFRYNPILNLSEKQVHFVWNAKDLHSRDSATVPGMARKPRASHLESGGCCHCQRPPTSFVMQLVQAQFLTVHVKKKHFKSEIIHDYADSLAELCPLYLSSCCQPETVYGLATKNSSSHLNCLRRKSERYFKNCQKRTNMWWDQLYKLPHNQMAIYIQQPQRHVDYPIATYWWPLFLKYKWRSKLW